MPDPPLAAQAIPGTFFAWLGPTLRVVSRRCWRDPAGTVSQYTFDLDAAWLADNDTQLDGGVNIGLNRATPNLEFYLGVSRRF